MLSETAQVPGNGKSAIEVAGRKGWERRAARLESRETQSCKSNTK